MQNKWTVEAMYPAVADLLLSGSPEERAEFTRRIRTNPSAVKVFGSIFGLLDSDGQLDDWTSTEARGAIWETVWRSKLDLEEFMAGIGRRAVSGLTLVDHGKDLTIETGWHDARFGEYFVWERFAFEADDPVLLFAELTTMFDKLDYLVMPRKGEQAEPALFRYHPERFRAYRVYADSAGKFYRQKVEPSGGMLKLQQAEELMRGVIEETNDKARLFPRKLKEGAPSPSLVIDAEGMLAMAYGRFVQAGRQILDFPALLTRMLAKTDVDDIPLNAIKLPYAAQYLHFGPQADLELEPGWVVDGAYVEQRGALGDVRFTVTAVPIDHAAAHRWYIYPEPMVTQDFVGQFQSMDLATAIDTVLAEKVARLRTAQARTGGDITAGLQAGLEAAATILPEGLQVLDSSPGLAAARETQATARHAVYKAALRLVVNALCYVSAYPEDIASVWPAGTPSSLREKAEHGKGKESQRAKSKLASLGYVPVHICGQRVAEVVDALDWPRGDTEKRETHWRRGHWRRQPYGPGNSLRKLKWLMPMLVGAKAGDAEPANGHVYLVS